MFSIFCVSIVANLTLISTAPRIIMLVGGCGRSTALRDEMAEEEEAESVKKTGAGFLFW